jgi:hypothetical protein
MTADRRHRWWEPTVSARRKAPPSPPLPGHVPPAHAEPATVRSRRRRVVIATGIGGAGLLGISLSTKAGSPQFYILTMGVAGTWVAGAFGSGSVQLDRIPGRENTQRRPVVVPVLTGAGAFGLFYGAARLARHIPPLNRAIGSVLRYADDGSTRLVLLTAGANAVAEELYFRGALWSVVEESHPRPQDHARLRRHDRRDPQPRARTRRHRDEPALRPPAPHLRRHSGSGAHPPHMVAPHAALSPAPVPDTPARGDRS